LVTQIKTALSELEKGNTFAFATGKEARQAERQMAQEFKYGGYILFPEEFECHLFSTVMNA
jgi:hypothetical protein